MILLYSLMEYMPMGGGNGRDGNITKRFTVVGESSNTQPALVSSKEPTHIV